MLDIRALHNAAEVISELLLDHPQNYDCGMYATAETLFAEELSAMNSQYKTNRSR